MFVALLASCTDLGLWELVLARAEDCGRGMDCGGDNFV
jgi:hypothetical protein